MLRSWIYILCTIGLALILPGCKTAEPGSKRPEIVGHYNSDLDAFITSLNRLASAGGDLSTIQNRFQEVRLAFKRIEYLLEYSDEQRHALFNGPPAVKALIHIPSLQVQEAQGLQVLEEMICLEIPSPDAFDDKLRSLRYQADLWKVFIQQYPVDADLIRRAALVHLIRIESLSLAGFDRPCFGASIPELRESFKALSHALPDDAAVRLQVDRIMNRLDACHYIEELAQVDFIKNYIQPLRHLLAESLQSSPESLPLPYDLKAESLYDSGFLNASFFSSRGMVTEESRQKIALGKKLFFDTLLSADGQLSCSTCHQPSRYFTDGLKLSRTNADEGHLKRNTPSLIHAAYQSVYMFDGRATSLEDQILHVFSNPAEFNAHLSDILRRLSDEPSYRQAFESLYGDMNPNALNLYSMTDALAAYVRSLSGHGSSFDRYMRGEIDKLPEDVLAGYQVFMTKGQCGTCHYPPGFAGLAPPFYKESEFENLGVPGILPSGAWTLDTDLGRYLIYENPAFRHFFKTSTVRNTDQTAPYMHNGVFSTLEEVLDFYDRGGGAGHGLPYINQTLPADSLELTLEERGYLLSFIRSLTDSSYMNYPDR